MKKVLITGATSGIGLALAKAYANDGWHVFACGRDRTALNELKTAYANITDLNFDLTNKSQTFAVLEHIQTPLELIILNAGTCEYLNQGEIDSSLFRRVFDINFFGVLHCIEALQSRFDHNTHLAIMGSTAAYLPFTRAEAYGASKAAIAYLTHSLATDLAPKGVTVTLISPGFVQTPLSDKNDFAMPMRLSAQEAASAIQKGLASKRAEIHFPKKFSLILKLLSILPISLKRKLMLSLARRNT